MKMTAARAHKLRTTAQVAAAKAGAPKPGLAPAMAETGSEGYEYRMQLLALGEDLRTLSNIQSLERKIEAKRGMIARYDQWVQGALSAKRGAQDDVVATMLVWAIDLAMWSRALRLAEHVLKHHVQLPERYRRTPGTLIAEEIADAANAPGSAGVPIGILRAVDHLTTEQDMPDEVRAKLKKALGLSYRAAADAFDPSAESGVAGGKPALLGTALAYLERALALDAKCGVKAHINALQRELAKIADARAAERPADNGDDA